MRLLAHRAALLASTLLLAAGCSSHTSQDPKPADSTPSASPAAVPQGLPTGPGPQGHYTVQKQPAPGTCHVGRSHGQPIPDPKCTPGARNPDVTQATLGSTVCHHGYTSTIRPPVSVTGEEKQANAKSYHYTGSLHDAEYDHFLPLSLGGDPNDPRNLWTEPPSPRHRPGSGPANPKDSVEFTIYRAVCDHKATLAKAQQAITHDWTTALTRLGLKRS